MSDPKILIIESKTNDNISNQAALSVLELIKQLDMRYERVETRDIFSIPCAAAISLEFVDYVGVIALGCVIDGINHNISDSIREVFRGMNDISMQYYIPLGLGICHAKDIDEAKQIVSSIYLDAASSCIQLMRLRAQDSNSNGYNFLSKYNN